VATKSSPLDPSLELLDRLRDEASERVGRELDDLRAHLIKCCEHSIERLRDCGFVSLESVTPVVEALAGMAASERERANHLDNLLRSTETELDGLRAEHQARQADTVDCREVAIRLERELDQAREAAAKAADDSAAELVASRTRFQQVVDTQSLELVRLKRELEQANRGDRLAGRPALDAGRGPLTARERLAETLPFEAIDAALSATPPVAEWPKAV
jgi:predicted  nucleic acid-binding Zn-ribbon protein